MSCRGCVAVSSLPKSQFLIASNSSEPPSTTFSHPGVSEEKEEKSFLFHQKPCLRLFWSRLDDWLSLFCFGSHFSQLTAHQLSISPAQQLSSRPGRPSRITTWELLEQSGSRHILAPGSFHRGSPCVQERLSLPSPCVQETVTTHSATQSAWQSQSGRVGAS